MKKVLVSFFVMFLFQSCISQNSKINGISFVASGNPATQKNIDPVKKIQANYAAVMPFGFIRNIDNPEVIFNSERQWYGERLEGVEQYISLLQKNDIKVMLKPQLWLWRGEYTGFLEPTTQTNWSLLESSYRDFILTYARVAQKTKVELFCVGTELEAFVKNRPQFWKDLITEVKTIYKGKLTYAANWDEYKRVPFWDQLDYIGIDGYFPISESQTPTVAEALKGWQPWKVEMEQVSRKWNLPILFTEYGYRSVDYAGKEPWDSTRSENQANHNAQSNLMQALFETLYKEQWFSGGFIWKWFIDYENVGGIDNNRFTPQNKPVEVIIKENFKAKY